MASRLFFTFLVYFLSLLHVSNSFSSYSVGKIPSLGRLTRIKSSISSYSPLTYTDPELSHLISKEWQRQYEGINFIASENYASSSVLEALGSGLTNKYSEGRPGARYYGGNEVIDELEKLTEARALALFNLTSSSSPDFLPFQTNWSVNVQPYSGTPANNAVLTGLLNNNDTILSLDLFSGGHLSHGYSPYSALSSIYAYNNFLIEKNRPNYFNSSLVTFNSSQFEMNLKKKNSHTTLSSRLFQILHYHTSMETGEPDYEEMEEIITKNLPKLLILGGSACTMDINCEKILKIKEKFPSLLILTDISHTAGFIAKQKLGNAFKYSDVVTFTCHKTLRGPRSALIFSKNHLKSKIDRAVFPGQQGGPHNNQIGAMAVALKEASSENYSKYIENVIENTKNIRNILKNDLNLTLLGNSSDHHIILINLKEKPFKNLYNKEILWRKKIEKQYNLNNNLKKKLLFCGLSDYIEKFFSSLGFYLNRNTISNDFPLPSPPSGLRLGCLSLTTRCKLLKKNNLNELKKIFIQLFELFEKELLLLIKFDEINEFLDYKNINNNEKFIIPSFYEKYFNFEQENSKNIKENSKNTKENTKNYKENLKLFSYSSNFPFYQPDETLPYHLLDVSSENSLLYNGKLIENSIINYFDTKNYIENKNNFLNKNYKKNNNFIKEYKKIIEKKQNLKNLIKNFSIKFPLPGYAESLFEDKI